MISAAALVVVTIALAAHLRWRSHTSRLIEHVDRSRQAERSAFSADADLNGLPMVVQGYLRTVLRDGQSVVRRATFHQRGQFLITPGSGRWVPFVATHHVGTGPPAFVWDARMRMAPGLSVQVRDAFVGGRGYMQASVLGAIPLVALEGTPDIAKGALQRYLAEAAWVPTVLLPSDSLTWTAAQGEPSVARATLTTGGVTVTVEVRFGADGLIESVYAPDRPRHVDGRDVPTPWEGRWLEYAERDGMRIPVRGEVAWLLPEGRQVYWRGEITRAWFE
jgi:hypothetical protein